MNELFYYLLPFLSAFLLCTALTAFLIPRLRRMKMGQKILEIGPIWHAPKEGTPTMGGLAFLLTAGAVSLVFFLFVAGQTPMRELYPPIITLLYAVGNGAIGIIDDLTKMRHRRNDGLTPTQKLLLQTALAVAYLALLRIYMPFDAEGISLLGLRLPAAMPTYFLLLLLLLGVTNCANLTDGIDGLAATVAAIIFATFALLFARRGLFVGGALSLIFLGCALAFFLFNHHPARIFMGDTGSLFLGAGVAALAFLLGSPFLSLVAGVVYVVEGASVILQVLYYKRTKKRLFLMAPLHHHFEKCGWSEGRIVAVFAALTLLASLLAVFLP